MDKIIVEKQIVATPVERRESTGSNAIWAIAMVIIVAVIAGAVYYSGILKTRPTPNKVNVEVAAPSSH